MARKSHEFGEEPATTTNWIRNDEAHSGKETDSFQGNGRRSGILKKKKTKLQKVVHTSQREGKEN